MTFKTDEQQRAARWKRSTEILPPEAREPAPYIDKDGEPGSRPYDFCVPAQYAIHSLLPEVRVDALALFAELAIPWHAGVDDGPSNHLLSSQVQCANALQQMVTDEDRIRLAFGDVLDIAEVLEIEPDRLLTFEYIGPQDFFGEAKDGVRTRGAHCTSVDAAFRYRTGDGQIELALIEWKYIESYRKRGAEPQRDRIRKIRYADAVNDPNGPVRSDVLSFDLLLDEPIYQLVRQQLLTHALEHAGCEGASRVRVVHVSPSGNVAYQKSLHRPEQQQVGATVNEIWHALLRHHDRFISIDSARFADPAITSAEYVARYGL